MVWPPNQMSLSARAPRLSITRPAGTGWSRSGSGAGGADEHRVHRADPAAHLVGRLELDQSHADHHADHVGEAQNGAECIKLLAKLKPRLLVLNKADLLDRSGASKSEELARDKLSFTPKAWTSAAFSVAARR